MEPISDILKKLRSNAGLSQKEEADLLRAHGVPVNNAHISRWENGSNNPSIEQFIGICNVYGIRNVHDVFGEGELLGLDKGLNKDGVRRLQEYREILLRHPDYAAVPVDTQDLQSVRSEEEAVSAGPDAGVAVERGLEQPKPSEKTLRSYALDHRDPVAEDRFVWISADDTIPERAAFAVVMQGDAMHPLIRHGARIWLENADSLEHGETGLIRFNGVLYIRTIDLADGVTVLRAHNDAYLPIEVASGDRFEILGRALVLPA